MTNIQGTKKADGGSDSLRNNRRRNGLWVAVYAFGAISGAAVDAILRELVAAGTLAGTGMGAKDWATIYVTTLALFVSIAAFVHNRRKSTRDAFLAIHEKMFDLEIQEGRGILFEKISTLDDAKRMRKEDPESFRKVNRAIAMWDVLAMYVNRGYLPKQIVMEEWGRNLAKYRKRVLIFGEVRGKRWEHYEKLSKEACEKHPSAADALRWEAESVKNIEQH
ncbi:hypothetical protein StoSoilB3_34920 [Arthrobacter sp. StoSoilB3]|nr:hypothetical protein StoSoilB3_34920 [Arthrobacter sp. StoSoilB3]